MAGSAKTQDSRILCRCSRSRCKVPSTAIGRGRVRVMYSETRSLGRWFRLDKVERVSYVKWCIPVDCTVIAVL